MSFGGNAVDSKVVELSLNNKDFEENAKTSISTLDKLKDALKFDKAYKAFDGINSSIRNVNTGVLFNGVQKIQASFSALDVIAMRTLTNITDSVERAAVAFTKSLTVDQVSAGWDKYAEKTSAVQTIMAATAKDFDNQETQMEHVNAQLEKLNWFTDETSYNFLDMVNNIGKFTANQVSLEDSVTAMEGISTWAAKSGANVNEAGRAMYNLSQAIAVGSVKLMDWKSIENANMATAEFKETALAAAEAAGTLTKSADGVYKTAKGTEVSIKAFNQTLSEGWFTSDVLIDTLDKYGGFTNELHASMEQLNNEITTSKMLEFVDAFADSSIDWKEATEETGLSMEALRPMLERLSSEEFEFGRKAFEAAQEAKTFQEAIDSVKDAASTGWMNTFELMFGDYLQAKELWTTLANDLYEIFAEGGNSRNELLRSAFDYSEAITSEEWAKVTKAGLASPEFIKAVLESADAHNDAVIDIEGGKKELVKALEGEMITIDDLNAAYNKLFATGVDSELSKQVEAAKETDDEFKTLFDTVSKYSSEDLDKVIFGDGAYAEGYEELESALDGMLTKLGMSQDEGNELIKVLKGESDGSMEVAKALSEMSDEELMQIGYTEENIKKLREAVKEGKTADEVFSEIGLPDKKTGGELWTETLYNSMESLVALVNTLRETWAEVFPPTTESQIYSFLQSLNEGSAKVLDFVQNSEEFKNVLRGIFSIFDLLVGVVTSFGSAVFNFAGDVMDLLGIDILTIASNVSTAIQGFRDWVTESGILSSVFGTISNVILAVINVFKGLIDSFMSLPIVSNNIKRFKAAFSMAFKEIGPFIQGGLDRINKFAEYVKSLDKISLKDLPNLFKKFKEDVLDYFLNFKGFKSISGAFKILGNDLKNAFVNIKNTASKYLTDLREQLGDSFAGKLLGFVMDTVSAITSGVSTIMGAGFSLSSAFEFVFTVVKNVIGGIIDFLGNINWGAVAGIALAIGVFAIIKKVIGALGDLWNLVMGVPKIMNSITGVFDSVSDTISAKKLATQADAVKTFAVAIATLVGCVAILTALDEGRMWEAVGVIGVLTAMLLGLTFAMGKIGKVNGFGIKASISLIAMAGSILILTKALAEIAAIQSDGLMRSLVVLTVLLGEMTLVAIALSKFAPKMAKGGMSLILFVLALKLLVGVVKEIDNMKLKDPGRTLGTLILLMTGLVAVSAITGKFKGSMKSGASMILIAASLLILVKAVKQLSSLDKKGLNNALVSIGILGAIMVAMAAITGRFKGSFRSGLSMVLMASSILILSQAVLQLGQMDPSSMNRALSAIMLLGACLSAISLIFSFTKSNVRQGASAVLLATSVWILSQAISNLANIDASGLDNATEALMKLMAIFGLLTVVTGLVKGPGLGVLVLAAAIGILGIVIYKLAELPVTKVVPIMDQLSKMLIALGICMGLLALVGMTGPAALVGVGSALLLVGGLGILVGLLGDFVGSGIEKFTAHLANVGNNLSAFSNSLEPFMTSMKSIGPDDFAGLSALTKSLIEIAEGEFASAIYKLFTGETPIASFANQLPDLAKGMSDYASNLSEDITDDKVKASTNLASMLASIAKEEIPEGGIVGWLAGNDSKITQFAEQLPGLAESLADYANTVSSGAFASDNVEASTNLASLLASIAGEEIPQGGIVGWLTGSDSNITAFAEQLPGLAEALTGYANTVSSGAFASDNVEASTNLASLLASIAGEEIPVGGIVGWLTGNDSNITTFGSQLAPLAQGLAEYANVISSATFDPDKVDASTNLASLLASISNNDMPDGGIFGWINGGATVISGFADQLVPLANGLVAYANTIAGSTSLDSGLVTKSTDLASLLASIATNEMPDGGIFGWINGGATVVSNFADQLVPLANGLIAYSDTIASSTSLDSDLTEKSANLASLLASITGDKIDDGGIIGFFTGSSTKVEDFADQLVPLAEALNGYASALDADAFSDSTKIEASTNLAGLLASIAGEKIEDGGIIGWLSGSGTKITDFADQLPGLAEGLQGYANALDDSITDQKVKDSTSLMELLSTLSADLPNNGFFEWITGASDKITAFGQQLPELGKGINDYAAALTAEFDSGKVEDSTKILTSLSSFMDVLKEAGYIDLIGGYGAALTELVQYLDTFAEDMTNIEGLEESMSSIQSLSDINFNSENLEKLKTDVGTLKDTINSLADIDDSGVGTFKSAVEELGTITVTEGAEESGADYASELAKGASGQTGQMAEAGTTLISALGDAAKSSSSLTDAVGTVVDGALAVLSNRVSDFTPKGTAIAEAIASGIKNSSAPSDAVGEIVTKAANAANSSDASSKFQSAGSAMMSSFETGIRSKGEQIISYVNSLASRIRSALSAAQKPIQKKQEEIDDNLISSVNASNTYVEQTGDKTVKSFELALAAFNTAIQTKIDTEPVIRPVLDISGVEAGANAIRDSLNNSVALGLSGNIGAIGNNLTREEDRTDEILEAINAVSRNLADGTGDTYILDGITYDDGSNVAGAIKTLVNTIKMRRRV